MTLGGLPRLPSSGSAYVQAGGAGIISVAFTHVFMSYLVANAWSAALTLFVCILLLGALARLALASVVGTALAFCVMSLVTGFRYPRIGADLSVWELLGLVSGLLLFLFFYPGNFRARDRKPHVLLLTEDMRLR